MPFNYEQSIWGVGEAQLKWGSPTAFRLKQALGALSGLPAGKVLEVGCGAGQFIRAIKHLRPNLECHGSDISAEAIKTAKIKNDGVIYEPNSNVLPYPDNSFNAVLIFDVLEHVADYKKLLAEIKRILKPSGIFYCFAPCEGDWTALWYYLRHFKVFTNLTEKYAGHVNHFSRAKWLKDFKEAGFEVERKRYSEHFLGQLLGVVVFWLMDKKAGEGQMNNETFFAELNQNQSGFLTLIKKTVNSLIYLESIIFSRLPSPNLHVVILSPPARGGETEGVGDSL